MILVSLVLALWVGWFAFARVPITEETSNVQIQRDGALLAQFQPAQIARIKPGQEATIQTQSGDALSAEKLNARVADVAGRDTNQLQANTARLYLQNNVHPQGPLTVTVTVDQVSPLTLLLRARTQ